MTKRKKGLMIACAFACVLAAGAGLGFTPARNFVSADTVTLSAEEASYWKEVPQISGWSWGSFDAEKNCFRAIPAEDFSGDVEFKFYDSEEQLILTAYEKVLNGEHAWYLDEDSVKLDAEDLSVYLNRNLGQLDAGEYTMTAYADDSQDGYRHFSSVSFSVRQAKNYWTKTPYIESWYKGEWTEAKDFSAPVAEAAYGDLVEYTIYGATDTDEIDYDAVYYRGTSNPDETPAVGELRGAEAGRYFLVAHVAGAKNYEELESVVPFRVFDSQATVAALEAAKEDAFAEVNRFAAELNVNIETKEVRDAMHNIDLATTVTGVQRGLSGTKLVIYKIYAKNAITKYALDLELDITINDPSLADEVRSINDAPDISTVEKNLAVAFGKIYDEGVKKERGKAAAELSEYAKQFGLEAYADFTGATTLEEVWELLALEKHKVDDRVLQEGGISDLNEYKERAKSSILNYAKYIGLDLGSTQDMLNLAKIDEAETPEEVDGLYEEAKIFVDAKLNTYKYERLFDLQQFAREYCEKYPLAKAEVSQIIDLDSTTLIGAALDEMDPTKKDKVPTVIWADAVYEKYCSQIKEIVLPYAKTTVKEELSRLAEDAKIPEFDAELSRFLQAVDDAETVDEVEEVLAAATFQIGNTLYTARMEMIRELDAFAADYFAEHNWNALQAALEEGKTKIYGAKSVEEIYEAGSAAKLGFMRTYVTAELDYYGEVYGDYDIIRIIETQKELCKTSTTVKGLQNILGKAGEQIYFAAKTTAPESLKTLSAHFANFDYSNDAKKIENAEDLEKLHTAYTAAVARLNALKEEVQTARDMLEMYAESYGLSVSSAPVLLALDKIYAAASPEDVPELVKEAKADIDAAAGKEQSRIGSVNAALIACTVIFAVAAVGLATLLVLVWRKKKAPAKKSEEPKAEAKEPAPERKEEATQKHEEVAERKEKAAERHEEVTEQKESDQENKQTPAE